MDIIELKYYLIGGLIFFILIILIIVNKNKNKKSKNSITKDTTKVVESARYSSMQIKKKSDSSSSAKRRSILEQAPIQSNGSKQQVVRWTSSSSYSDDIKKLNQYEKNLTSPDLVNSDSIKLNVLLVDDSLVVRKYIGDLLTSNDYMVVTKNDGKEGLDYLKNVDIRPDLIISDIEMPVMDGFAFINEIRKDIKYEDVPILVISAHAESHLILMEEEKIQGFIKKPFANKDLLKQINYLIEG